MKLRFQDVMPIIYRIRQPICQLYKIKQCLKDKKEVKAYDYAIQCQDDLVKLIDFIKDNCSDYKPD